MAFAAGFQSLDAAFSDQKSGAVSSSAPIPRKFWVKANSVAKGGTVFEFDVPNGSARIDATFKCEGQSGTPEMTTTASQPIGIKKYEGKVDAIFRSEGLADEHIEIINGTFRRPIVNAQIKTKSEQVIDGSKTGIGGSAGAAAGDGAGLANRMREQGTEIEGISKLLGNRFVERAHLNENLYNCLQSENRKPLILISGDARIGKSVMIARLILRCATISLLSDLPYFPQMNAGIVWDFISDYGEKSEANAKSVIAFCTIPKPKLNTVSSRDIFNNLSAQLSQLLPGFWVTAKKLRDHRDPTILVSDSEYLKQEILIPLRCVLPSDDDCVYTIVIDGLDNSLPIHRNRTEGEIRNTLAGILSSREIIEAIPSNVSIICAARTEFQMELDWFGADSTDHLQLSGYENAEEIIKFARPKLEAIALKCEDPIRASRARELLLPIVVSRSHGLVHAAVALVASLESDPSSIDRLFEPSRAISLSAPNEKEIPSPSKNESAAKPSGN